MKIKAVLNNSILTRQSSKIAIGVIGACALAASAGPSGGPYDLSWHTIDGGGAINMTGGQFTLSGTIGQPDAGAVMTGGSFTLTGGFWAGIDPADSCPADLTNDGLLDFFDVSAFLDAFGAQDPAADFTGDGLFDFFDVSEFLDAFGAGCP